MCVCMGVRVCARACVRVCADEAARPTAGLILRHVAAAALRALPEATLAWQSHSMAAAVSAESALLPQHRSVPDRLLLSWPG